MSKSTKKRHGDNMYPLYNAKSMAFYLCGFHPQNLYLQSNHEKKIIKYSIKEHSTKCLPSAPQNCQGHQQQGKSEKTSQTKEAKETTNES